MFSNSIIQKLQDLIDFNNYTQPDIVNDPESNDIVSIERYSHDVDFYFKEGFKIGLTIGIECIGAKIKPEIEKQILAVLIKHEIL